MEEVFDRLRGELTEDSSRIAKDIIKEHTIELLQSLSFNMGDEQLSVDEIQRSTAMAYDNLKSQIEKVNIIGQLQLSRERALKIKQINLTDQEQSLEKNTEELNRREKELQAWSRRNSKLSKEKR